MPPCDAPLGPTGAARCEHQAPAEAPDGVLHGTAGESEDDGFEQVDPDLQDVEPPEVHRPVDRGSPNSLGWSGNAYQ